MENVPRPLASTLPEPLPTRTGNGIAIRARDDGRGVKELRPGHGLTGMRERLEQVGGKLEIETQPAKGFRLNAWLPLSGGVA